MNQKRNLINLQDDDVSVILNVILEKLVVWMDWLAIRPIGAGHVDVIDPSHFVPQASQSVCLSVCLSVCINNSQNVESKQRKMKPFLP
jgi:hypothetical protein